VAMAMALPWCVECWYIWYRFHVTYKSNNVLIIPIS
jgi:hypothetical protein